MTFKDIRRREWFAIGRCIYVSGADGPPILMAEIADTPDSNPGAVNAIADHVVDLHNAALHAEIGTGQ